MFVTKIYTNPLVLMVMAAIASILFSSLVGAFPVHEGLQKAAFIFGTGLAGGYFSVAVVFSAKSNTMVESNSNFTKFDLNVFVSILSALLILTGLVIFVGVTAFTDSVAEGVASSTAGGILGVIMAFAKKDSE